MFIAHRIDANSPDLAETLPQVMALSSKVFNPWPQPNAKYTSVEHWKECLSHETSAIIYLTRYTEHGSDHAEFKEPVAFLFAYPRTHTPPLEDGSSGSLHIWLAGVLPECRRGGCLQRMMEELTVDPRPLYTICTSPERFPNMWSWLSKRGWHVEREFPEGKIMLSKKGDSFSEGRNKVTNVVW